jgi:hypothetical protein
MHVLDDEDEEDDDEEDDFMEMLFFDSREGDLIGEFKKVLQYLKDAYFEPSDITAQPHHHSYQNESNKMDEEIQEEQVDVTLGHEFPYKDYEKETPTAAESLIKETMESIQMDYDTLRTSQRDKRHKLFSPLNKLRVKNILETVDIVIQTIEKKEAEGKENYKMYRENLRNNLLYSPPPPQPPPPPSSSFSSSSSLPKRRKRVEYERRGEEWNDETSRVQEKERFVLYEDPKQSNESILNSRSNAVFVGSSSHGDVGGGGGNGTLTLEDINQLFQTNNLRYRIMLEMKSLEYLNNCESSYVYLRYMFLIAIAREETVAFEVSKLCDGKKFKNFPLYMRLLVDEIEGVPFNTHNVTAIILDFVKAGALYYMNNIVKPTLLFKFFNHSDYRKNSSN